MIIIIFFVFLVYFCWVFFFVLLHVTSFGSGRVSGEKKILKKGRLRKKNNVKKIQSCIHYEHKKRLRFLWNNKNVLFFSVFGEKNNNLWQSDFHSVCFLAYFSFFSSLYVSCFFCFFCSSSFKVNLKVHYRNWRAILLLVPKTTTS